jgi:uncharacterized C2H2 Zn-finger protein
MIYECKCCCYITDNNNNFIRHQNSKKHTTKHNEENITFLEAKNTFSPVNNTFSEQNHTFSEQNHTHEVNSKFSCCKCGKEYKCQKYLADHEKICKGIDILTCPRCMRTFKHQQNKSRHIKNANCKPKSIFEYLKNKHGAINNILITNNTNNTNDKESKHSFIQTQQNAKTINNINNTTINTNIFINDYGNERRDYITNDDILKIIKYCDNNIIPRFISYKHFNPEYPENKNIKFQNNIYLIKKEGDWNNIDGDILAKELYNDNKHEIGKFCFENDDKIGAYLQNEDKIERLKEKTDFNSIELQGQDKDIKKKIKSVIKTQKD